MRRVIVPYDRRLRDRARELRCRSTSTEIRLWKRINRGQLRGLDFHRQKPLVHFIVDFYCCEAMLAIEIDGPVHDADVERDIQRDAILAHHGVRVLRIRADEIERDIEAVVRRIERWLDDHPGRPGIIEES